MKLSRQHLAHFSRSLWLALVMFLVFCAVFVIYVRAEKQIDRANERRQQSLSMANELRQSSDDLTRMVRSYVATGNPLFKRHYQEVLDIRNGQAPRPLQYQHVYWDLVLADDARPRVMGAAVPLLTLIQRTGISQQELALLTEAKQHSDALTRTEFAAIMLVESATPVADSARLKAIGMLHDAHYHEAKANIMRPISQFQQLADQRTQAAVETAARHATHMRLILILFGGVLVYLLWAAQKSLRAILGGSVNELHTRITQLGSGDFSTPIPLAEGDHGSVLSWVCETQLKLAQLDAQRLESEKKNQRLNKLYAALSQCNQAIVRCSNEAELFQQVCRIVVNFGGMKMAWVGTVDPRTQQVVPIAAFGDGTDYLDGLVISADALDPRGQGPTGTAIRSGQPCWCQDFKHDPHTTPWRDQAAAFQWTASAALPLQARQDTLRVLNLYSDLANAFDEETRTLLLKLVSDIDYALKNFALEAQREQAEKRIQYLAHFDALTGLPNRVQLDDRAKYSLSLAQRNQVPVALMFLDLDHFKDINDTLGHSIGDALLVELAQRLRHILRQGDTIARLGGDEFIFLLYGSDAAAASHVAQKVLDVIASPFQIELYDLSITGSLGISLYPDDGADTETLLKRADAAMYRAKQEGRNGYCFFTAEMQARAARNLRLAHALRQAVERQQLQVHYQPQIDLNSGQIIGAEALLRWSHPELGEVSPAEFIPAAEDSGMIHCIGEWVLRQAVQQAHQWRQDGLPPMVMAVNLSAVQFRHPDLPDLVSRILDEEGLPPEYLELELTEGVAMHDPQGAVTIMNHLHARGVRMSIDDFGTGYSSLSQLKKFKVYKLKIDQSFVRDINTDPEDKAIVAAIIHMAKSLGLHTIAEGVESAEQLAFLREQGCDEIQGYFYSRPLPPAQFKAYTQHLHEALSPPVRSIRHHPRAAP